MFWRREVYWDSRWLWQLAMTRRAWQRFTSHMTYGASCRGSLCGKRFDAGHRQFTSKTSLWASFLSFFSSSSLVPIAAVFLRYKQIPAQASCQTPVIICVWEIRSNLQLTSLPSSVGDRSAGDGLTWLTSAIGIRKAGRAHFLYILGEEVVLFVPMGEPLRRLCILRYDT
jgi:hypothetical protein